MSTFESLEDSFLKKSSDPIGTDFQEIQRRKAEATQAGNPTKETYEASLKKKRVVSGLAEMLEAKLKNARETDQEVTEEESDESTTVTFVTTSVRYEDEVMIPQNEVSEEEVQRFYPHEKYNDVFTSPDEALKEAPRFAEKNKYGDMINQFEPKTASEDDITEGRSVSTIAAPGEPSMNPSDSEVLEHIKSHRQKRGERVYSAADDSSISKSEPKETELDEATYLAGRSSHLPTSDVTQPPFKVLQDTPKIIQQNDEQSESDTE